MKSIIIEKNLSHDDHISHQYTINTNDSIIDHHIISSTTSSSHHTHQIWIISRIQHIFTTTFLPAGYPHSVRPEYLSYQYWDSLQGISSYVRGVLTARSILAGAGVGSAQASAISAAIIWAMKDGLGMISSLILAYFYADIFEIYFKEWRLIADILNNIGLTLSLLTSLRLFSSQYIILTCLSTICHACCGLIAGSTKSRISSHFARDGHIADITAKESTQETAVALIGLCIGMICTRCLGDDIHTTWIIFILLLSIHTYANYRLVKVLIVDVLNPQRIYLVVNHLLDHQHHIRNKNDHDDHHHHPTPDMIAPRETLWRPLYLHYYGPKMGQSCFDIISCLSQYDISYHDVMKIWYDYHYMIGYDLHGHLIVSIDDTCDEDHQLQAYIISIYVYHHHQQQHHHHVDHVSYMKMLSSIPAAMIWYDEHCSPERLSSYGWDVTRNKTRLYINTWRIIRSKEKQS